MRASNAAYECPHTKGPWKNLRGLDGKGWQLRSYEILPMFGLEPNSAIPRDFEATICIGDTMVRILRRDDVKQTGVKRRVQAYCNGCGLNVCAGHLHQHLKGCAQYQDNTSK
jgi:hypothetical protein